MSLYDAVTFAGDRIKTGTVEDDDTPVSVIDQPRRKKRAPAA